MENNNHQPIQIYGKYSLGSGSILPDSNLLYSDIDNPEVIEAQKKSIIKDLHKAGISIDKIKNYEIMDVGTGRQAIAFHLLGAKKVKHYDLSPENAARMKSFIDANSLQDGITTECVDLMEYTLPKNKFDLVFLHGIAQHFSNVAAGLINCMEAVKEGGYLSLYFYRSGTFFHFLVYLIRDLIGKDVNHKECFVNSILLYSDGYQPNRYVSNIMDSFFVPHMHLYAPQSYLAFVDECGFKVVSSSKLDPLGRDIDHTYAYPNVVLTCQKTEAKDLRRCDLDILSPRKAVDQLDPNNYSPDDKEILKTIKGYALMKETVLLKNPPASVIMSIAFKLYGFLASMDNSLNRSDFSKTGEDYHRELQAILNNAKKLLKEEF